MAYNHGCNQECISLKPGLAPLKSLQCCFSLQGPWHEQKVSADIVKLREYI